MAEDRPGPSEGNAYGAASVSQNLGDIEFPISRDELIERAGDRQIQWSEDRSFRLRELLEKSDKDQFNSMADVEETVGNVTE